MDSLFLVELLDAYTFVAVLRTNVDGVPAGTMLTVRANHDDPQAWKSSSLLDVDPSLYTAEIEQSAYAPFPTSGTLSEVVMSNAVASVSAQPSQARKTLRFRDARYEELLRVKPPDLYATPAQDNKDQQGDSRDSDELTTLVASHVQDNEDQQGDSGGVRTRVAKDLENFADSSKPTFTQQPAVAQLSGHEDSSSRPSGRQRRRQSRPLRATVLQSSTCVFLGRLDASEGAPTLEWTRRCTIPGRVRLFDLLTPEWITVLSTTMTSSLISAQEVYAFRLDSSDQSFIVDDSAEDRVFLRERFQHNMGFGYKLGSPETKVQGMNLFVTKIIPGSVHNSNHQLSEYLLLRRTARILGVSERNRCAYRKASSQEDFERILTPEWFSLLMHANRLIQSWICEPKKTKYALFWETSVHSPSFTNTQLNDDQYRIVWSLLEGTKYPKNFQAQAAKEKEAAAQAQAAKDTYDWLVRMAKNSRSALVCKDPSNFDVASFWACECITSEDFHEQFMHQRGVILLPTFVTTKDKLDNFYAKVQKVLSTLRKSMTPEQNSDETPGQNSYRQRPLETNLTLQEHVGNVIDSLYHRRMSTSVAISSAERQTRLRRANIRLSGAEHYFRSL